MLVDRHFLRPEGIVSCSDGQVRTQTSAEVARAYNAHMHEIIDAIFALVLGAHAELNWLRAQPLNEKELQKTLDSIVSDGNRACEIVVRLRALMNEVPNADEVPALKQPNLSPPYARKNGVFRSTE
jgi:hypothetical protein